MPKGVPLSRGEKRIVSHALQSYESFRDNHLTSHKRRPSRFDAVSELCGISRTTAIAIAREHKRSGQVLPPKKSGRQKKEPLIPIEGPNGVTYSTSLSTIGMYMRDIVRQYHARGTKVTTSRISHALMDMYGVKLCEKTVRKYLGLTGFKYKTIHRQEILRESASIKAKVAPFIKARCANRYATLATRKPVVWTDESYIHEHSASKKGWITGNADEKIAGKKSDGSLYVLLAAAITGYSNGRSNSNGIPNGANGWLKDTCLTWKSTLKTGDYHGAVNADLYKKWFRDKLLPSLPDRPCQIVLDNAKYHTIDSEAPPVSKLKKAELIEIAQKLQVERATELTVKQLKQWIKAKRLQYPPKPDIAKLAEALGHEVVFTPPYMPEFQACELAWSVMKNHVKAEYGNGKPITERIKDGYAQVDGDMWMRLARHVEQFEKAEEEKLNVVDESLLVYLDTSDASDDELDEMDPSNIDQDSDTDM